MTIELILDAKAQIAESLLFVPEEGKLYWADIRAPALHALHLGTGGTQCWQVPADLGGFALDGNGRALLALRTGLYWLQLASGELELIITAPYNSELIRFNETACDSAGRFWAGAMTDPPPGVKTQRSGALYSYTASEGLRAHPDFATITNGMAWNREENLFFLSHSKERMVYKYPYDAAGGKLGPRQEFLNLKAEPGIPDGAAMDAAGDYWCAKHGAGCLHRYTPDGALAQVVELPVSQPTMCCFAGENLEYMYISTARDGLDEAALAREPHAGGIFRIKPDRPGLPRHWRVAGPDAS